MSSCKSDQFMETKTSSVCVDSCESKVFWVNESRSAPNRYCVKSADECVFARQESVTINGNQVEYTRCFDSCSKYAYGQECLYSCPPESFLQEDGKTCGAACASGMFKVAKVEGESVRVCVAYASGCRSPRTQQVTVEGA